MRLISHDYQHVERVVVQFLIVQQGIIRDSKSFRTERRYHFGTESSKSVCFANFCYAGSFSRGSVGAMVFRQ